MSVLKLKVQTNVHIQLRHLYNDIHNLPIYDTSSYFGGPLHCINDYNPLMDRLYQKHLDFKITSGADIDLIIDHYQINRRFINDIPNRAFVSTVRSRILLKKLIEIFHTQELLDEAILIYTLSN